MAERGRPQTREQGGCQEPASHSRARRDRSSTRGPKSEEGFPVKTQWMTSWTSYPQVGRRTYPYGGMFYTSQIAPLNSQRWHSDRDKFIQAMEECKNHEWLDIKELAPLHYMHYVAKCFLDTNGHNLKGLGLHTKWIRTQSYYHWKVAELNQLQHCPHLWGLPVPAGPMECPSVLQQPQRPNRPGAMAPGTSGSSRVGGLTTSGSSSESSWMECRAGDSASWFDRVTHAKTRPGACKRKKTDAEQQAPGCPFPLISEEARKEAMGAIYEHVAG